MAFSAPDQWSAHPLMVQQITTVCGFPGRSEWCAINLVPIGLSYAKSHMTSGRLPGAIMVSIPERVATSAAIIFVLIPPIYQVCTLTACNRTNMVGNLFNHRNQFRIWILRGSFRTNLVDPLTNKGCSACTKIATRADKLSLSLL